MSISYYPKVCNLCGGKVIYTKKKNITRNETEHIYFCTACHAYVGATKDKYRRARGILANKPMRRLRRKCHEVFDNMWEIPSERRILYDKLAEQLGVVPEDCHFAYFDMETLQKAYDIIVSWRSEPNVFR